MGSSCSSGDAARSNDELLLPTPKVSVDVTERGVSLAFLIKLAESEGVDESWTVQEMVDAYIRPKSIHK